MGDAETLRRTLFSAATSGDSERMATLCEQECETILEHFAAWRTVPDEVKADEKAGVAYVEGLIQVARWFAEQRRDDRLLKSFLAGPEQNPMTPWQLALAEVEDFWEAGEYPSAAERLERIIADHEDRQGDGSDAFLVIALGRLGESYFHAGTVDRALAPMQRSLDLATAGGDDEAVMAALGSLYELCRYLDDKEHAAAHARRLAEMLLAAGKDEEAAQVHRDAERTKIGEPALRVAAFVDGRELSDDAGDELPTGPIHFEFVRDRVMLGSARAALEGGRTRVAEGDLAGGLAAFERACELDPFAPDPVHARAFALAQLDRMAEAAAAYERLEELAPGWHESRAEAWLVREVVAGRLTNAAWRATMAIAEGPESAQDKVELASAMIAAGIDFPLLRLLLGDGLAAVGEAARAMAQYRHALAGEIDADTKTRLLTRLGLPTHESAGERRVLEEAVALSGNHLAAAQARLALRLLDRDARR